MDQKWNTILSENSRKFRPDVPTKAHALLSGSICPTGFRGFGNWQEVSLSVPKCITFGEHRSEGGTSHPVRGFGGEKLSPGLGKKFEPTPFFLKHLEHFFQCMPCLTPFAKNSIQS